MLHRISIPIILTFLLGGCYQISYRVDNQQGATYMHDEWNQYFLLGLAPLEERTRLSEVCHGDKLIRVEVRHLPGNVLATALSLGLSGANSVRVECLSTRVPSQKAG